MNNQNDQNSQGKLWNIEDEYNKSGVKVNELSEKDKKEVISIL